MVTFYYLIVYFSIGFFLFLIIREFINTKSDFILIFVSFLSIFINITIIFGNVFRFSIVFLAFNYLLFGLYLLNGALVAASIFERGIEKS